MGLDMSLFKMPRYKNATAQDVSNIESYLSWIEAKKRGSEYANCTFKEWCGVDVKDLPPQEIIDFYAALYNIKYWSWDVDLQYGNKMIMQEIAYWRKENAIHKWFVENIQNGEDDCRFHREITKSDLENLKHICKTILNTCCVVDGEIMVNSVVASELLPTQSGFFFGGTEYDEWYMDGLKYTIDIVDKILKETDFNTYAIYYVSSW